MGTRALQRLVCYWLASSSVPHHLPVKGSHLSGKSRMKLAIPDRDGTINALGDEDFIASPADWQPLPGALFLAALLPVLVRLALSVTPIAFWDSKPNFTCC